MGDHSVIVAKCLALKNRHEILGYKFVLGDNRKPLHQCLTEQESIKWISMQRRELTYRQRVFSGDWQLNESSRDQLTSQDMSVKEEISTTKSTFYANLPQRNDTEKYLIVDALHSSTSLG
jgi:hypothetical protein